MSEVPRPQDQVVNIGRLLDVIGAVRENVEDANWPFSDDAFSDASPDEVASALLAVHAFAYEKRERLEKPKRATSAHHLAGYLLGLSSQELIAASKVLKATLRKEGDTTNPTSLILTQHSVRFMVPNMAENIASSINRKRWDWQPSRLKTQEDTDSLADMTAEVPDEPPQQVLPRATPLLKPLSGEELPHVAITHRYIRLLDLDIHQAVALGEMLDATKPPSHMRTKQRHEVATLMRARFANIPLGTLQDDGGLTESQRLRVVKLIQFDNPQSVYQQIVDEHNSGRHARRVARDINDGLNMYADWLEEHKSD